MSQSAMASTILHLTGAVFRGLRASKPGGLAISDIVTASQLPDTVVCNATSGCLHWRRHAERQHRRRLSAGLHEIGPR
jgi:hypothetical protein